jgi:hypothetical protein
MIVLGKQAQRLVIHDGDTIFIIGSAKSTFARFFGSVSLIDNRGRPHASLGPGLPERSVVDPVVGDSNGHTVPIGYRVAAAPILGGLHHEHRLERQAA